MLSWNIEDRKKSHGASGELKLIEKIGENREKIGKGSGVAVEKY